MESGQYSEERGYAKGGWDQEQEGKAQYQRGSIIGIRVERVKNTKNAGETIRENYVADRSRIEKFD